MGGMVDTRHRMRVWQAWLDDAIRLAGMTGRDLSEELARRGADPVSRRRISCGSVPDAEVVVMVALTLRQEPSAALRAAGFPLLACLVEQSCSGGAPDWSRP